MKKRTVMTWEISYREAIAISLFAAALIIFFFATLARIVRKEKEGTPDSLWNLHPSREVPAPPKTIRPPSPEFPPEGQSIPVFHRYPDPWPTINIKRKKHTTPQKLRFRKRHIGCHFIIKRGCHFVIKKQPQKFV
jgi:hypothetical protein